MADTQRCKRCGEDVSIEAFSPSFRGRAGTPCRACVAEKRRERYRTDPLFREQNNARLKAWGERNAARVLEAKKAHYETNKEAFFQRAAEYRAAHPERRRAAVSRWHKENPIRSMAHTRARALRKVVQTPDDADFDAIVALYEESARLTRETGIRHHVDHIVPLARGGAHHQDNLRVVTQLENLRKGTKLLQECAR